MLLQCELARPGYQRIPLEVPDMPKSQRSSQNMALRVVLEKKQKKADMTRDVEESSSVHYCWKGWRF